MHTKGHLVRLFWRRWDACRPPRPRRAPVLPSLRLTRERSRFNFEVAAPRVGGEDSSIIILNAPFLISPKRGLPYCSVGTTGRIEAT